MQQRNRSEKKMEEGNSEHGKRHHIAFAGRRIPLPRSRIARILTGSVLVVLGIFGFLPILGFWMVPLGLFVLSYDVPSVRRLRRRLEIWWHRRRQKKTGKPAR